MHNNHTRTMTEGNIYGHLFHLFLPLIFGNLLQQFYNTIDASSLPDIPGMKNLPPQSFLTFYWTSFWLLILDLE